MRSNRVHALWLLTTAYWLLITGCQRDPSVAIFTNTPRPPAVSVATSTPTLTPSLTSTDTLTPTATPITPSNTPTPTLTFTPSNTPTPTFTFTPTFTRTPYPTKKPGATATKVPTFQPMASLPEPHLWLERPIGEDGVDYVERTYTYGNTQQGALPPHHGVEFYNPAGTPVLAAAEGIVIFAGPDTSLTPLSPASNFYGNVIVVELSQSIGGQPVYTLYGHLSIIHAVPGQYVRAGELLGKVGGTGVARGGPHLHFEVRVGYNDYLSTRNPELWLKPYPKWGTLVGRVVDSKGQLVPLASISLRSDSINNSDSPVNRYLTTYAAETVNPDSAYGENFVVMDLPPGTYTVAAVTTKTYKQTVVIKSDQITWIEFRNVNPPPTWTPTPTGTLDTATPMATATATVTATPKP